MLYSLAVRTDARRTGVARALIDALLPYLHSFSRLYGVTGPKSAGLYAACGFTVLSPGEAIQLRLGEVQVNIPLVGQDSWFSRLL